MMIGQTVKNKVDKSVKSIEPSLWNSIWDSVCYSLVDSMNVSLYRYVSFSLRDSVWGSICLK